MSDANKAVVRRWFIDELSETYAWHGPGDMTVKGRDGIQEMQRSYLTAFPDLHFTNEDHG